MAGRSASGADFFNFPPFFTLQAVEATRKKQLELWRRLVLEDFASKKGDTPVLALDSYPLFVNQAIDRKLDTAGREALAQDLVQTGHGQWQTQGKTLYIFVKTPSEWASIIYSFVQQNALTGTIYTLYELHSGDLTLGTPIQGIEPTACVEALRILEASGKAEVYHSEESVDETGVKFL